MAVCDMCGAEKKLFKAEVEGTTLTVCENCAQYGKVVGRVPDPKYVQKLKLRPKRREKPLFSDDELSIGLLPDYSQIIKDKREKLNLKQEDFAKKINEKVSIIHKMETGHFEPNMKLAKKIERFLRVKITGAQGENSETMGHTDSGSFTLGDFISIKK